MPAARKRRVGAAGSKPGAAALDDPISEHVRRAVEAWPQIDPEVEGIVSRVDRIERYLESAFRTSLGEVGLTKEEWKVIMRLHREAHSHGWLCRELDVATGSMTNRLDK